MLKDCFNWKNRGLFSNFAKSLFQEFSVAIPLDWCPFFRGPHLLSSGPPQLHTSLAGLPIYGGVTGAWTALVAAITVVTLQIYKITLLCTSLYSALAEKWHCISGHPLRLMRLKGFAHWIMWFLLARHWILCLWGGDTETIHFTNFPHLQLIEIFPLGICSGSVPLLHSEIGQPTKGWRKCTFEINLPYLGLRWAGMLLDNPLQANNQETPLHCIHGEVWEKNRWPDFVRAMQSNGVCPMLLDFDNLIGVCIAL